jgi:NADH-quinone oxidoreductase subunit C
MGLASDTLASELRAVCGERLVLHVSGADEITAEVASNDLLDVARLLRDDPTLQFGMLIDVAGVDYLDYGRVEWRTVQATASGFSRGVNSAAPHTLRGDRRYAVAYQLLSLTHNRRLRLRCWCEELEGGEEPTVDSVTDVWAGAAWFEREAFDLFGIFFRNHPDLRRLLTDYGFVGHPFRKDFPLIGHVEVRYDPIQKRVVYEPVSIEPRTLVPRVIRNDNRYDPALLNKPPASTPPAGGAGG